MENTRLNRTEQESLRAYFYLFISNYKVPELLMGWEDM